MWLSGSRQVLASVTEHLDNQQHQVDSRGAPNSEEGGPRALGAAMFPVVQQAPQSSTPYFG